MEEIMSTREAAEYLQVTNFTILRLIRRESIKARRLGRIWLVDRRSVDDYIERNKGKAPHDPTRD
jgi:excisionase family DNA binding protein